MRTATRVALALALLFGLAACKTVLGGIYLLDGPEFTEVTDVPPGKALVYLYRPPKAQGGASGLGIYGQRIEELDDREAVRRVGAAEGLVGSPSSDGGVILWDVARDLDEDGNWKSESQSRFATGLVVYDLRRSRHNFNPDGGGVYPDLRGFIEQAPIRAWFEKSGGYQAVFADPGTYWFPGGDPEILVPQTRVRFDGLLLTVKAGDVLYVKDEFDDSPRLIPRDQALVELSECRLASGNR